MSSYYVCLKKVVEYAQRIWSHFFTSKFGPVATGQLEMEVSTAYSTTSVLVIECNSLVNSQVCYSHFSLDVQLIKLSWSAPRFGHHVKLKQYFFVLSPFLIQRTIRISAERVSTFAFS